MRKYNFYAGPAVMPQEVLAELRDTMVDYKGIGLSLMETSHRSKEYDEVHMGTMNLIRELFSVPKNYKIVFLGGGATLQFGMVPLNFLEEGKSADFVVSGEWAKKALADAKKVGKTSVVFDGAETKYTTLPDRDDIFHRDATYAHITSNETIGGLQWQRWPDTGPVPLIADMSSDIMSRPVPVEKFGMIYAGAQKNLGPAGVTVAIIREDLLARCPKTLVTYLNYATHAEKDSLYNTPPVFPVYAMMLVLQWVKKNGGVAGMMAMGRKKADAIYEVIDGSNGYYTCPVERKNRSVMNIVFKLPSEELDSKFVKEAEKEGMIGLKGHRDVGGCRASLYNAMTLEGAQALAQFMKSFAARNG